ncbi:MAG: HAD-IB family hydrolase [Pseudomonadota bacterium]|nr:HAD-IB family hydrolase [Pseudomonadota bacterium]
MILTLFDLDGTLIPQDSDHLFGQHLIDIGWADAQDFKRRNDDFYADYEQGRLDMAAYVDFATAPWRGRPAEALEAELAAFIVTRVRPMVHPAALALVQRHQQAGDRVAVVTATNAVVTRPIARLFGIDTLIATELARDAHGAFTGAIAGVPAFREGKIERVAQWLASEGATLADFDTSTFYSDSINDLPLLERVTSPVATNPGPALAQVAQARGWPVLQLFG